MRKYIAVLFLLSLVATPIVSQLNISNPFFVSGVLKPSSISSTLNTSLISYWKLDETSGTRVDSEPTGTAQDLTDNNTVTSSTGILGNAGQFTSANSEYLNRSDSADLSVGQNQPFTVAGWVYLDTKSSTMAFVSKYGTGTPREYRSRYNNGSDRFEATFYNGGGFAIVTADTFGSPSTSTWYLFAFGYDGSSAWISINGGAKDTATGGIGADDSTADFEIGTVSSGSYWNGRVDEVGFWKKSLSATELTELYNSGSGKTCCPF